jgi:hypothetical protein
MSEHEMLVEKIMSASGIFGHQRKHDIATEMRCHIEDIIDEELAAGHDEKEIERLVALRFGEPEEIAQDFATVYRSQRIVFTMLSYALLGIVSVFLVAAFVYTIQFGAARWIGASTAHIFAKSHMQSEIPLLAGVTFGYLCLYFSERLFGRKRFAKSIAFTGTFFIFAGICMKLLGFAGVAPLFAGLLYASFVRSLEQIFSFSVLRLVGVLVFFTLIGRLAPYFAPCSIAWFLFLPMYLAIAVSSQFISYFASIFDRQILRRHFA